jgi:hypothetical protein
MSESYNFHTTLIIIFMIIFIRQTMAEDIIFLMRAEMPGMSFKAWNS